MTNIPDKIDSEKNNPGISQQAFKVTALLLFYASILGFVFILYNNFGKPPFPPEKKMDGAEYFQFIFSIHFVDIVSLLLSTTTGILGFRLLSIAGAASKEIIPRADHDLISGLITCEKEKGIELYIKLNSLTGITGFFTKVGITGLPLATIALTIFFTFAGLIFGFESKLLDLANLTLGAFLGSYVQRQISGASTRSTQDNSQTDGHQHT